MDTSELDYLLPPELIAQQPLAVRDSSRLLVYERASGSTRRRSFSDLPRELPDGALVVLNDTRVVPGRLRVRRPGGGDAEVLLLERRNGQGLWEALARPSRRLRPGMRLSMVDSTIHARPDAPSGASGPLPSLSERPCGLSDRAVRFARPGLAEASSLACAPASCPRAAS